MTDSIYAADGLIGCATPQANPTVEPELRRILPGSVNLQMTRAAAMGAPKERLLKYFRNLPDTLGGYGGMTLDAFGLACTASSYLLDEGEETRSTGNWSTQFGFPVRTAAQALHHALTHLGVKRLLIGSPYPDWIHDACVTFWSRAGFEVCKAVTVQPDMGDTKAIYALDTQAVGKQLYSALKGSEADALLITGTGLPTLPLRNPLQESLGMPVLSANLCLAWDLMSIARPASKVTTNLEARLRSEPASA